MSDSSKYVWVPDKKNLYRKGLIIKEEGKTVKVQVEGTSDVVDLDVAKLDKVNPEQFNQVGDMAELTYLNEPSVVNNLRERWQNDKIYTYSGLFLVAVNPYREIPSMYDVATMMNFKNKRRDETEPHIFAIAEQAIRNLRETRRDQSILITGESGAGKTENTKKTIQYLSSVANCVSGGIDERIIQTNPILEAFGNAQTIRNANSSRFGKFIKIHFDDAKETIVGASIQWYLLEKSRVLTQHANERSYHIFYQLISGAPADIKEQLLIPANAESKDFTYLASGASTIPGVNDSAAYQMLVEAFKTMGFSEAEIFGIMGVVAIVLLLGQIKYKKTSADQGAVADMSDVERVCQLLGVQPSEFVSAVLSPKIKTGRREFVKQSRTAAQALHTTNAIAKALYERLFGYIVSQLNLRLGAKDISANSSNIGVLDIAGFEIFEENSFEQLCINYTNEKLQQFFNHHMFVLEQEEYIKQKVDWEYVDYGADLQPTIDLIEQSTNPMGIFSCLNEESALLSGSDASFNSKLVNQWKGKNPKFSPSRLGQGFAIQHYAQTVEYQTDGWMEKNKDPLSDAAESMLSQSSNALIKSLFDTSSPTSASDSASTPGSSAVSAPSSPVKGKSMLFRTVAQKHKEQLNSLMTHLQATHPHFVRCILPNTQKSPHIFDNRLVLDQLRYNGVLEGIRIARSGFPNRIEFKDFCQRYRALAGKINVPLNTQHACASILHSIKQDPATYRVGLSKVFFRNGVLAELEHRLDNLLREQVLQLQSLARGAIIREECNRILHRKRAAKVLATCFRANLKNASDPWWMITTSLKPLLMTKEGMDSSRKDMRMQKLETTLNKLREEQVELVSSRNELRGELIAALRAKEELIEEIVNLRKEQKHINSEHEFAITAARSRDEASTAALTQLSQQHSKLKDEYDELVVLKQKVESEFEERLKQASAKAEEDMLKFTSEQRDSLAAVETLLEGARKEVAEHKKEISDLKEQLKRSESDTMSAMNEVSALKEKLANNTTELTEKLKVSDSEAAKLRENLENLQQLNQTLKSDLDKVTQSSDLGKKEIAELKTALEERENVLATLQETHKKLVETQSASEDEAVKTKSLLEERTNKLESTTKEVTKLREWLSKAKSEIKGAVATTKELATLRELHKSTEAKLSTAESELESTKSEINELKERLSKAPKAEDVEKRQGQLQEALSELTLAKEQIETYAERTKKLEADLEEANSKLKKSEGDFKDSQALLEKSRTEHMTTTVKLEKEVKSHKKDADELASLKEKLEEANRKLKDYESKNSNLALKVSQSVKPEELDLVKQNLTKSQAEVENLTKQLTSKVNRQELVDANAKLAEANASIRKLKDQLAGSVSADKLGKKTAELATANATIARLKEQSASSVAKTELSAAQDRIRRLEKDVDLTNENLLKLNEELLVSQSRCEKLQKECDKLKSASPEMKRQLESAQSARDKALTELEILKRTVSDARTGSESANRELESIKLAKQKLSDKLRELTARNQELERESKRSKDEVSVKQRDVERLKGTIGSFNNRFNAAIEEKDAEIQELTTKLAAAKEELLKTQTQAPASSGVSLNRQRFIPNGVKQQIADSNHNIAQLQAAVDGLTRDLDAARKENARHIIEAKKYEKALFDKKMLVQELSKLKLERGLNSKESAISHAQEVHTKKLESELKLLSLELARRERALKSRESSASGTTTNNDPQSSSEIAQMRKNLRLAELKNIQLEKQLKSMAIAQRNSNILPDTPSSPTSDDRFSYPKPRSVNGLRDISNDRRVSGNNALASNVIAKIAEAESRETAIYRERANEYLNKLEKAELIIESAVQGEKSAKDQLEAMRDRLSRINDDHRSELQSMKTEVERRDLIIKDLRNKATLSDKLDRELKASMQKIKDLNAERTRLASEKSRLETRLHDLLASNHGVSKQKDEQIVLLRKNEDQILRDYSELRWKLDRKDHLVEQLRGSLSDADARNEELRIELEKSRKQDLEKDNLVRRINRQLSEAKERYLTAERNLESATLRSTRTPRDYNEPAFI